MRNSLGCSVASAAAPAACAGDELSGTRTRQDRSGLRRFLHEIISWREED